MLTLIRVPRTESNGGPGFPDSICDGLDDLKDESGSVLDRATILVRPIVRHVLRELIG